MLLAVVLFVHSLVAPHRRLVAEARSVATELSAGEAGESHDEGQFLLHTFQDVVARLKDKERELQTLHLREKTRADETEALATDIIRSMTTGLVSLDPSGRVAVVNPAAEKIFGLEASAWRGRPFGDVFVGSQELRDRVEEALSQGALSPQEPGAVPPRRRSHAPSWSLGHPAPVPRWRAQRGARASRRSHGDRRAPRAALPEGESRAIGRNGGGNRARVPERTRDDPRKREAS